MRRYRPTSFPIKAYPLDAYPTKSRHAASIMLMIHNNLDPAVAQFPHELITYGGNGSVFQNWAQYRLVMKYLCEMEDDQTLVMYSGHPLAFSHPTRSSACCGDKWDGDSQLFEPGRLRTNECVGRHAIRSNDRWFIHVHRPTRHCSRHHHHAPQCCKTPPRAKGRGGPFWYHLHHKWARWYVRCPSESRDHRRGRMHHR